jgi:hypothetical protein
MLFPKLFQLALLLIFHHLELLVVLFLLSHVPRDLLFLFFLPTDPLLLHLDLLELPELRLLLLKLVLLPRQSALPLLLSVLLELAIMLLPLVLPHLLQSHFLPLVTFSLFDDFPLLLYLLAIEFILVPFLNDLLLLFQNLLLLGCIVMDFKFCLSYRFRGIIFGVFKYSLLVSQLLKSLHMPRP